MNAKHVASQILHQLGGRMFLAMTGAGNKPLIADVNEDGNPYFMCELPSIEEQPFNIHNYLFFKVIYMPSDTYNVEFYAQDTTVAKAFKYIYCDQLRDLFESESNLLTSINSRENSTIRIDDNGLVLTN